MTLKTMMIRMTLESACEWGRSKGRTLERGELLLLLGFAAAAEFRIGRLLILKIRKMRRGTILMSMPKIKSLVIIKITKILHIQMMQRFPT